jgi:ERCC4-type nuclease
MQTRTFRQAHTRGPKTPVQLLRHGQPAISVPPCQIIIDTREQLPWSFAGFVRIAETETRALQTGDYAIAGMEDLFRVERKRMDELYLTLSNQLVNRIRFLRERERLTAFKRSFIVVEGTPEQIKVAGRRSEYHPNAVLGSLDAIAVKFGIQILYVDHREAAEERVANLAALAFAYHYAEQRGLSNCLCEDDL